MVIRLLPCMLMSTPPIVPPFKATRICLFHEFVRSFAESFVRLLVLSFGSRFRSFVGTIILSFSDSVRSLISFVRLLRSFFPCVSSFIVSLVRSFIHCFLVPSFSDAVRAAISFVPMHFRLFGDFVGSMIMIAVVVRAGESARAPSPCTSSRGTPTFSPSSTSGTHPNVPDVDTRPYPLDSTASLSLHSTLSSVCKRKNAQDAEVRLIRGS